MSKEKYIETGTILDAICHRKMQRVADISTATYDKWKAGCMATEHEKSSRLADALLLKKPSVIAEIKKASPSEGVIRADTDVAAIAREYAENGAAAISVVTEKDFFQGDTSWLQTVKKTVSLPVLRKDFIMDEKQVYESKIAGADAVLLIAAILNEQALGQLYRLIYSLGMEALVEIRTRGELDKAIGAGARIIGINNRNLENFKVGRDEFISLVKHIPKDKIVVAESGIHSAEDLQFMIQQGADAALVGTYLMRSEHPGKALKALYKI